MSPPPIKEQNEKELPEDADPQQDSGYYMGTLVEALSTLLKVEDAVKVCSGEVVII